MMETGGMEEMMGNHEMNFEEMESHMKEMHPGLSEEELKEHHESMHGTKEA